MLSQGLQQKLLQKLSPQQIQFIKLLQVPTAQLEARIEQELEENPALLEADEAYDLDEFPAGEPDDGFSEEEDPNGGLKDTIPKDEEAGERIEKSADYNDQYAEEDYSYRTHQQKDPNAEHYEAPVVQEDTIYDQLREQIHLLELSGKERQIAAIIIGNIEEDGYLRRDVMALADDLAFKYNLDATPEAVEEVLAKVQHLEPAGIAARDLQECLILQLDRFPEGKGVAAAQQIIMDCFPEFTKKHFGRIKEKCELSDDEFRAAYELILKLNPKPGGTAASRQTAQYIVPDFLLSVENGELQVRLNNKNAPELQVNEKYRRMLSEFEERAKDSPAARETLQFVRSKVEDAKWFIDAIQQRQITLMKTMLTIAGKQKAFFLSDGDDAQLRPMILKDIAEEIGMDISTVSRVANSKYVQTPFGIYQLKYFFSEGIRTDSGEEVSNREVKSILKRLIDEEDKQKPLSDMKLADILAGQGYNIARRTVAKYREQLELPVARLRKEY